MGPFQRLNRFETLELRRAEIEGLLAAGVAMRGAEWL
jgi:hypothetical protein